MTIRRTRGVLVVAACTALVVAACGDDDEPEAEAPAESTTEATGSEAAPETTAAAPETTAAAPASTTAEAPATTAATPETTVAEDDFVLDEPVKIVTAWEVLGESPNAISDYEYGAQLAIARINEEGGIGGLPVEYERISVNAIDAAQAANGIRLALEADATVLVGPVSPTAVAAASPLIDAAEQPSVVITIDRATLQDGEFGSEWMFNIRPAPTAWYQAAADFATEDLGAADVGVMYVNIPYGTEAEPVITARIEENGATVAANRSYDLTATDLTEQVLAMQDAQAVINWGYPNPVALQVNQMVDNNLNIPTVDTTAAGSAVVGGLVREEALANLYGVQPCVPQDDDRELTQQFVTDLQDQFDFKANSNAANGYDSVWVALQAVKLAKSTDKEAVREALATVEVTDGVCAPLYHAGENGSLSKYLAIANFAGGNETMVREFTGD
jgi:branched-chain amino acid transport system substrate-binding protein